MQIVNNKKTEYKIDASSSDESSDYDVQDFCPNKQSPVLSLNDENSPVNHIQTNVHLTK